MSDKPKKYRTQSTMNVQTKAGTVGIRHDSVRGMIEVNFNDVEARYGALCIQNDQNLDLIARLRQEAQIHAGEARCHKSSLHECYQSVTGATGEPASWNGAKPVERVVAAAVAAIDLMDHIIGKALENGEVKPKDLEEAQDAINTFRAVRRGAYYPTTTVEQRAVEMSKAKPNVLVVITLKDGQQEAYYSHQLVSESERIKLGYVTIAKFKGGAPLKEV